MHKFHDIILAYLMGDTIQVKTEASRWVTVTRKPEEGLPSFDNPRFEFRIKPVTAKVRYIKILARLTGSYRIINIHSEDTLEIMKKDKAFVKILSKWIEEEVEL